MKLDKLEVKTIVATIFVALLLGWVARQPVWIWGFAVLYGVFVLLWKWNPWDKKLETILLGLTVLVGYFLSGFGGAAAALAVPFAGDIFDTIVGWIKPVSVQKATA